MDVSIKNLSYLHNGSCILRNITGYFQKGKVSVFMGPSGAGKTTLMDLMVGRRKSGQLCGDIRYEIDGTSQFPQKIGYCQSFDIHIGELTVYQNLYYSCQLRATTKLTNSQIQDICLSVASVVGLDSAFHTIVGNILIKGISGGQQKLLSIATELLSNPSVLLLDEPTTGLDSLTSLSIMKILNRLATHSQKTIICTIHQPSLEMIQLSHHLFLLSDGCVVFNGDMNNLMEYLQRCIFPYFSLSGNSPSLLLSNLPPPPRIVIPTTIPNPVETILELLGTPANRPHLITLWEHQNPSEWVTDMEPSPSLAMDSRLTTVQMTTNTSKETVLPYYRIFWISLQRHLLYKILSPHGFLFLLILNLLAGVFYGLFYYRNGVSLANTDLLLAPDDGTIKFNSFAYNLVSLQFSTLLYSIFTQSLLISSAYHMKNFYSREIFSFQLTSNAPITVVNSATPSKPLSRSLFKFPTRDSFAHFVPHLLIITIDLGLLLLSLYLYIFIFLNMIYPYGVQWTYYSILIMVALVGFIFSYVSVLISNTPITAFLIYICFSSFQCIFSGYFIAEDDLPSFLRWTVDCSAVYYGMGQMMVNEFHGNKGYQGDIILYLYGYDDFELYDSLKHLGNFLIAGESIVIVLILGIMCWKGVQYISNEEFEAKMQKIREAELQEESHDLAQPGRESIITIEIPRATGTGSLAPLQTTLLDDNSASSTPPVSRKTRQTSILRQSLTNRILNSVAEIIQPEYDRPSESTLSAPSNHTDPRQSNVARYTYVDSAPSASNATQHLIPQAKRVEIEFESLYYTIKNVQSDIILLNNINGRVQPGELCAIMGPTGSGKTTLLNVLAGRVSVGKVEGNVTVNKNPFKGIQEANSQLDRSRPRYGYVMQDDAHVPVLTVKETFQFAAMLRLRRTSSASVEGEVEEMMNLLGIDHIANNFIGTDEHRTISRGQLRRVTIGCELIDSSSLIFLDEPTSGLDSYLASTIVDTLVVLASTGRTLLCTIHQPSASVFNKFHKLLFLTKGYLVYAGPVQNCSAYYEHLNFPPVRDENPAEYLVNMLSKLPIRERDVVNSNLEDKKGKSIEGLALLILLRERHQAKDSLSSAPSILPIIIQPPKSFLDSLSEYYSNLINSTIPLLMVIMQRDMLKEYRRLRFWCLFNLRSLLIGFAIGAVWNNIDCEGFAILERLGLFLTVYLLSSIWMTEFIPSFYNDKVIFYREREVNAITTFTQWVCNGVLYIPLFLLSIILLTAPIYILADLRDGNDEGEYDPDDPNGDSIADGDTTQNGYDGLLYHYMIFFVTVYLALITNLTFNLILIYIVPNHMMHLIIFPGITLAIQALLSGYSVLPSTVDASLEWIFYANPCFYYMDSLFVNEFKGNECADSFHNDYTFLSTAYSYTIPVPRVLLYTFYMICVQKVLGFIAMKYINHTKA